MKRILITFVALLLAVAFAYEPNPLTRLEVHAAAAFTDGFIIPCAADAVARNPNAYFVCVDTSMTPWDIYDLSNWADYGLYDWVVFRAWERNDSGGLTAGWINPTRQELLVIGLFRNLVVYSVASLAD